MSDKDQIDAILDFWNRIGPDGWFEKNDAIDREIVQKFSDIHARGAAGELERWQNDPRSCLALVILLDQFSRNMFRGDRRAFAQDALALEAARHAITKGFDKAVEPGLKGFFYMPFMHSECIADQRRCISLFHGDGGGSESLKYAILHHDIIARFGRFPHRNGVLDRHTTPSEKAYLEAGGFSG